MASSASFNQAIARVQKMEQEYGLLIILSGSIASVTSREGLDDAVNGTFREILGFDQLVIFKENAAGKEYKLFYHENSFDYERYKDDRYAASSKIFTSTINCPEPILLSKNELQKIGPVPFCIGNTFQATASMWVSCSIVSKDFNGIFLMAFERDNVPDKNRMHLLQRLSAQLAITLTNIAFIEQNILFPKIETAVTPAAADETSDNMGIIGNSTAISKVRALIKIVCKTESTVLINGESGTGKELVAKAIHYNSGRGKKPLVKINCAAIPRELLESELFGHEKGSFTGATSQKIGKFSQAHQGTLFLDDICEMPIELQAKLLRVLQEKEIQRIGSSRTIVVDTRIIAATNKDLSEEIRKGNFRADLFYRLNVFPIDLPPLRERIDDVVDLAGFFIQRYCIRNKKAVKAIAAKMLDRLCIHNWPGNVRELEHVIERAVLLSPGKMIKEVQFSGNTGPNSALGNDAIKTWNEFEKEYILGVIKHCNGRISGPSGAASLLKIPPTTLISKMERLGIKKRYFSDK